MLLKPVKIFECVTCSCEATHATNLATLFCAHMLQWSSGVLGHVSKYCIAIVQSACYNTDMMMV